MVTMIGAMWPSVAMADIIEQGYPEIAATSYVVVEGGSGQILFGKNYQAQLDPASITKIMTAVLAIESGKLDEMVTVPALSTEITLESTSVSLREGEKIKMDALLDATIVFSANDAAYAIGTHLGGTSEKFAQMMNDKAKELGMNNTHFTNAHGLSEELHKTTAEDMAILGRYAMSLDVYREVCKKKTVAFKAENADKILYNKNKLLDIMPEATGVKNGFTTNAQYTLVGSAQKDGRELIGVIMGSTTEAIYQDMKTLLDYGFEATKVVPIIQKETTLTTVQFTEKKSMRIVAAEDFAVTLLKDSNATVDYELKLKNFKRPIAKSDVVGGIEVRLDGAVVHEVPLISLDAIGREINWLFLFTGFMTIMYILQMLLRSWRMFQKRYLGSRKPLEAGEAPVKSKVDEYKNFVSSLEHPKGNPSDTRPSGSRGGTSTRKQPPKKF